jgi:thiamine biosynthesis protein ThiS
MPTLLINGETREFTEAAFPGTLGELLQALDLDPTRIVAEVDGSVVPREAMADHPLRPEQTIELVHFVGGG